MEDLRTDEVQVLEDGKPCAVQSFRLVQAEGEKAPRPAEPGAQPTAPPAAKPDGGQPPPETAWSASSPSSSTSSARTGRGMHGRPPSSSRVGPSRRALCSRSTRWGRGSRSCRRSPRTGRPPAAIEKATRGIDQARDPARRAGYDNATEEAFSLARDAQAAAKAHDPDARFMAMQAQMLLFTDSVMREGQGQASLQPLLAIARALSLVQGRSPSSTSPRALPSRLPSRTSSRRP